MYSTGKLRVEDPRGNSYTLDSFFENVIELKDAVEDAQDAKDLLRSVNKLSKFYDWVVYKDTKDKTIFKSEDKLGNVHYFIVPKAGVEKTGFVKVSLTNPSNIPFALSNEFEDTVSFEEDIKDCETDAEILKVVKKYSKYNTGWKIDRKTPEKVRLSSKDPFGNTHYLILYKAGVNESKSVLEKVLAGQSVRKAILEEAQPGDIVAYTGSKAVEELEKLEKGMPLRVKVRAEGDFTQAIYMGKAEVQNREVYNFFTGDGLTGMFGLSPNFIKNNPDIEITFDANDMMEVGRLAAMIRKHGDKND